MAGKLQSTILRNAQGQLVEQKPATINQLASQYNLQAPPTTPVGGSLIGASPDSQKMLGTPAQKQSALRQSTDAVTTLQESQLDKRYRTQKTAEEQATADKQKSLQEKLSGSAGRVQDLVGAEVAKLTPTSATTQLQTAVPTGTDVQAAEVNKANLINQVNGLIASGKSATDLEVQAKLNELAAVTGQEPTQLSDMVKQGALAQFRDETGNLVARSLQDTIGVQQLLPSLGMTAAELSGLLAIPEETVNKMSLSELSRAIDMVGSQTQATATQAASPALGAAERTLMREQGREQATTGVASSDAATLRLGDEMASANRIKFGGRDWTVEELLADNNISQLVSDYILHPGSPESQQLASDPQAQPLLAFVERNKEALIQAASHFSEAAQENAEIQTFNKNIGTIGTSGTLSPEVMSKLGLPAGRQTSRIAEPAIITTLKSLPTDAQRTAISGINDFESKYPNQVGWASLSPQDLTKAVTPDNTGKTPLNYLASNLELKKLAESSNNIDELVGMLYGGTADKNLLNEQLSNVALNRKMGNKVQGPAADVNNDGRIDENDIPDIRSMIMSNYDNSDNLSEILAGNKPKTAPGFTPQDLPTSQKLLYSTLVNKLGPDFQGDKATQALSSILEAAKMSASVANKPMDPGQLDLIDAILAQSEVPGNDSAPTPEQAGANKLSWSDLQAEAKKLRGYITDPESSPWIQRNKQAADKKQADADKKKADAEKAKKEKTLTEMVLGGTTVGTAKATERAIGADNTISRAISNSLTTPVKTVKRWLK